MGLLKELGKMTQGIMESVIGPMVGRADMANAIGYRENAGVPTSVTPNFIGEKLFDTSGLDFYIAFGTSSGNWTPMSIDTLSATELAFLDGATAGTPVASKVIVADSNTNVGALKVTSLAIGTSGSETAVTATGAQINTGAIAGSATRTSTTTDTISAADHNTVIYLNSATGYVTTLPAPIAGFHCEVISKLANTSGNHTIVTNASANIIKGNQNSVAGDAGDFGTADDTISFVANQSVAGDKVAIYSDGTSWFAYAISKVAAGVTFTQAS